MKIDFVVMWVDGKDKKWYEKKNKYSGNTKNDAEDSVIRYRDWDILKYWFRGIEENANWVNNIFFVVDHQVPDWLDTSNPKIKVVNHEDFIPKDILPTFNSSTIEMNLFRIKDLSEHFVLFNDDMFVINKTKPEDFFKKGLPRESLVVNPIVPQGNDELLDHKKLNDLDIVNKYYSSKDLRKNLFKYFYLGYKKDLIRNILTLMYPKIPGFKTYHFSTSLLKSVIIDIWNKENDRLTKSASSRFRTKYDCNQYLYKYLQLASGKFYPQRTDFGFYYEIKNNNDILNKVFYKTKYKIACLNDSDESIDFESAKSDIVKIFEKKFPNKCSFEK